MNYIPNLKYKTTLCLKWSQKLLCEKGDDCYFAHGSNDLRNLEQNRVAISAQNQAQLQYRPLQNYKTIFCKFYSRGLCKLGEGCTFAHQRREKKTKSIQPDYPPLENYNPYYNYYPAGYQWLNDYAYPQYPMEQDQYFYDPHAFPNMEIMKGSIETACEEGDGPAGMQKDMQVGENIIERLPRSNSIIENCSIDFNQLGQ